MSAALCRTEFRSMGNWTVRPIQRHPQSGTSTHLECTCEYNSRL